MSPSLSKSPPLPPTFKLDEEVVASVEQGIVSILVSDSERSKNASLRRTLSADMSSKKWLAQNGFSPMKKIASSEQLLLAIAVDTSSSSDDEDDDVKKDLAGRAQSDIWNSIQEAKQKQGAEKSGDYSTWRSILSQKLEESKSLPPPYVHPLVKRSASSLSEKSLKICTESLGCETGSDGFSSYPTSVGNIDDDKGEKHEPLHLGRVMPQSFDMEDCYVVKYNHAVSKKTQSRSLSFPPPIPSLSRRDGASVSMQSRRDNGRLVLEAISVSTEKNFEAQREGGRLILKLANHALSSQDTDEVEVDDEVEDMSAELGEDVESVDGNSEDEEEEESEEEDKEAQEVELVMDQTPKLSSGMMNVHKPPFFIKKPIGPPNRSPTRQRSKLNEVANYEKEEEELQKSLPLCPPMACPMIPTPPLLSPSSPPAPGLVTNTSSFNAYEYFWRTKPPTITLISPIPRELSALKNYSSNYISKNAATKDVQESMIVRGNKSYYLGPLLKSCNKPRSSPFVCESKCIATS